MLDAVSSLLTATAATKRVLVVVLIRSVDPAPTVATAPPGPVPGIPDSRRHNGQRPA
jgi:hypothetical protein